MGDSGAPHRDCADHAARGQNGSERRRREICVTATRFHGIAEAWVARFRGLAPTATVMSALRASNRRSLPRRCRWYCTLDEQVCALGTALGECGPLRAVTIQV